MPANGHRIFLFQLKQRSQKLNFSKIIFCIRSQFMARLKSRNKVIWDRLHSLVPIFSQKNIGEKGLTIKTVLHML
jgi:hypothetical protein